MITGTHGDKNPSNPLIGYDAHYPCQRKEMLTSLKGDPVKMMMPRSLVLNNSGMY